MGRREREEMASCTVLALDDPDIGIKVDFALNQAITCRSIKATVRVTRLEGAVAQIRIECRLGRRRIDGIVAIAEINQN